MLNCKLTLKNFKYTLACTALALLAACSAQEGANTGLAGTNNPLAATIPIAKPEVASQSTDTTVIGTSPKRDLLANLALAYPGGVLPAERAAEAATLLAQNPAVLKFNADATKGAAQAAGFTSQTANVTPQSHTTYTVGLSAPVQRAQNTTLFGSYFFSIFPSEMIDALIANPLWNLEGTAFHASLGINPGLAPVYRFRNLINGSYLYTISEAEKSNIIANYSAYYTLEGPAWFASPVTAAGYSPLYRFRNLTNGTYLFSAYTSERDAIIANYPAVFFYEGISYYVRQTAGLELSLLAGSGAIASADGTGAAASFNGATGMAKDGAGNVYVADYNGHTIRKITPAGVVSTFAGSPGVAGSTNGSLLAARFNNPYGLVMDSNSTAMFITDVNNCQIRLLSLINSQVSTLAGNAASCVEANNASYALATFSNGIAGITINSAGTQLLIANQNAGTVRIISSSGGTATLATGLIRPQFIALDSAQNTYVTEYFGHSIQKITPTGVKTTLAGLPGAVGSADGTGAAARFSSPTAIVNDGADNFYVNDSGNKTIRKITATGVVTTVAGTVGVNTFAEGFLPSSFAGEGYGMAVANGKLYFSTYSPSRILQINGLP